MMCPKSEHVEKAGDAPLLMAGRSGRACRVTRDTPGGDWARLDARSLEASLETTTHLHLHPQATLLEQLKG